MNDGLLPYAPRSNQDGFRLIQLELQNHYVLSPKGKICRIQFFNEEKGDIININDKPYSTVIIGANGLGKSFILGAVAEIFRHIKRLKEEGRKSENLLKFRFSIQYFMNGSIYRISNITEKKELFVKKQGVDDYYSCWVNNKSVGLHWCVLPDTVLASAITINDRFKTQKQQDGFYWYLGARNENSPSTTGTRTLVRKTVSAIAECLSHDEYFRGKLMDLLESLDLERKMEIQYSIRYKRVFLKPGMTEDDFVKIFDDWKVVYQEAGSQRETAPWGHKKFANIRKDTKNVKLMVSFLNRITDDKRITKGNHLTYTIQEDNLREDWKAIQLLSELDVLSYPQIRVYKKIGNKGDSGEFLFEESSSGETNILCQFINILSRIKHHSLVLIDEPETSSHPNWQIRYIDWLNDIFSRFFTCHFIISTHSHFILSDLEPENSTIIALERGDDGLLNNIGEGVNTFCWSTDDILYRVFHVRNTRNFVFEGKVADLYNRISHRDNDYEGIKSLVNELSKYQLNAEDPLRQLIKKALDYVESI